MDYVKFGVVGMGTTPNSAWPYHFLGCKVHPKIKFISFYDLNEKKRTKLTKSFKMKSFSSYESLLKSDIDAILIIVPHYLHEEMVVAAAEAGKHVLCEKPMATTIEGCDKMIKATKKAEVKFMIAENHRFLPAHQYIRGIVHNGIIGKVFMIRSYEGVPEIHNLMRVDFWKGHPIKAGGGSLIDMGVHKFATMNWIIEDTVDSAYCWLTKQLTNLKEKAEDNAMIFLKYKSGVIAESVLSFTVISPPTNQLEIFGTQGTIIENHEWENPVRIYSSNEKVGKNKDKWYSPKIKHGPFPEYYYLSMGNEDAYFTDCILEDKEPEFTPNHAKEAVATALLGYLSAINGRTTSMTELIDVVSDRGSKSILEQLVNIVQDNYLL
jgi:predicted dehydrogenase